MVYDSKYSSAIVEAIASSMSYFFWEINQRYKTCTLIIRDEEAVAIENSED